MLARTRKRLAENWTTYPLFGTDSFRRHIEAAYRTMWERSQQGKAASSFAVSAA